MAKFRDILVYTRQGGNLFENRHHFQLPEKLNNPWPGLAPYTDPYISKNNCLFCGRDKESFEMTRMIDDNLFVTLYGKSGNGKTSLLNAGVFPHLRKMQYVPISIRLGMESSSRTFQDSIIRAIEKHFDSDKIKEFWVIPPMSDRSADNYLWNYFARHHFYADKQRTKPVHPVIVLDQFEEVYKKRKQDADILLRQIHYMMDDIHKLNSCITQDGERYEYEYNFRFVISIREDDLFLLEDSIDNNYMQQMKRTRYRLLPINPQGARDVILKPAEKNHLFAEDEKDKIVETIIAISKGGEKNSPISSNVLSLICNHIYVSYYQVLGGEGQITYKLVEDIVSENPLEKFYLEATKNLTRNERAYLEDNFVAANGRRGIVSLANVENVFKKKIDSLLYGPLKILQEDNGKVELIHDSFCQVLLNHKNKRQERWRNIVEHIAMMMMCLAIFYLSIEIVSFAWSIETRSIIQNVFQFAMNNIPIYLPVFLFVIASTIRYTFPVRFTQFSAFIILLPMFYDLFISTDSATRLSVTYYVIGIVLLAFLTVDYIIVKRKRKQFKPKEELKFWSLFEIWSLRFWLLVYMCLLLYSLMYKSVDGSYTNGEFGYMAMVFMVPLFFSLFNRENWVWIMCALIPISLMVYVTSDIEFLALNNSSFTGYLGFGIISVLFSCFLFWACIAIAESGIKGTIWGIIILLFFFGYYCLFYHNKLLLLAIWCLFFYSLVFLLEETKNIPTILTYVSTFLFTIGLFVFMRGYNPTIAGVFTEKQTSTWRWKNVITYDGEEYRLRDAVTGHDLLGVGFKKYGKNGELKIPINKTVNIGCSVYNPLIEISNDSNELTYYVKPNFEERIASNAVRNRLESQVFSYNRLYLFNMFAGFKQMKDYYPKLCMVQKKLLSKEQQGISEILRTNNDSIIKNDLPRQLCKGLSCSWLYNSIDGAMPAIDSENANCYIVAFVCFLYSYYYEDIFEYQNKDWDGQFELIAQIYLEILEFNRDATPKDEFLQYVLPRLINYYKEAEDHGLKTQLYGKIIRLQQLAINYGLGEEDWAHISLPSPIDIDIKSYYKEFLYREKMKER